VATDKFGTYSAIMQKLKARQFDPVYLLYGEETYFIDHISDFIEKNALSESEKGFNQTVLYGRDTTISAIISAAKRYPMMSDYQVIIVKEAQNLKFTEEIENYISNPLKSTILVFNVMGKKVDKRTKFFKIAQKYVTFEGEKFYDNELPSFINGLVKSKGLSINQRTSELIASYIGSNLSRISNEIEKISINKNGAGEITDEDVEKYVGISREFNSFELQNAIAGRNTSKAFYISEHLCRAKDFSIIPVLAQLTNFFAKTLSIGNNNELDRKTLQSKFGLTYFQANDALSLLKKYHRRELLNAITIFAEYDLKSKGVNQNPVDNSELMKEMLFKIFEPMKIK